MKLGGMTAHALDARRVSYGVVWHAGGRPQPGRLRVDPDALHLMDYTEPGKILAELVYEDLAAIKLAPAAKGRRSITLESRRGGWIEIESAVDRWILPDLLGRAANHLVATAARRLLVSIRLRPEAMRHAADVVRGESRLSTAPPQAYDVFVLDDEVLLLFEPDHGEPRPLSNEPWEVIASWHDSIVEISIAEETMSDPWQASSCPKLR
jgi:hypothetical protein